jgi:hypothetical protein
MSPLRFHHHTNRLIDYYEKMNEEHIIAVILTSGLISQDRGNVVLSPIDTVELYEKCRVALIESARPQRST